MSFKLAEIREILGEAYTDDIGRKLVNLHRTVVDPMIEQLDDAKRDAAKYKTEAEKLPGIQKELDELKKGEDWKAKYDQEKKAHDDYKAQVAREATTAKVKAAYKKLLTEEKISEKTIDAILNATDYSGMKLKEDDTLDNVEGLKKDIDSKWGGFRVAQRQRGERVDNPPAGAPSGGDSTVRERMAEMHARRYGTPPETK